MKNFKNFLKLVRHVGISGFWCQEQNQWHFFGSFSIIINLQKDTSLKNSCFTSRETWVREPIWINRQSNFWKFWFIEILMKKVEKRFFNQIFLPKWNASSQILMGESSQVSLINKSLIIDITQNYRHFLESLDYQDFPSRIPQKDFLINCSNRSVYFFIVILSLEIKPVVAEENELEQWSSPSLLGFFRFLRLPEFWWKDHIERFSSTISTTSFFFSIDLSMKLNLCFRRITISTTNMIQC